MTNLIDKLMALAYDYRILRNGTYEQVEAAHNALRTALEAALEQTMKDTQEQQMLKSCPHYGPSPARDAWIAGYAAAMKPGGEPVYAYRSRRCAEFLTCDKDSYLQFQKLPNSYEVTIFYTAPPAQTPDVEILERIIAESYQVMGILADEAGRFDDPAVTKALDNVGFVEFMYDNVLPFPSKPTPPRLTEQDIDAIWKQVLQGHSDEYVTTAIIATETAVRAQFLGGRNE